MTNKGNADDYGCGEAKLVVTSRSPANAREMVQALRGVLPHSCVRGTGLVGVFLLETEGDPFEIAQRVSRECGDHLGRSVVILEEVESGVEAVRDAAVRIATGRIAGGEAYCFRLHKAGAHWLREDTAIVEREIGRSIWNALMMKRGTDPRVNLEDPDVCIVAEVLGPKTAVGLSRKEWHKLPSAPPTEAA